MPSLAGLCRTARLLGLLALGVLLLPMGAGQALADPLHDVYTVSGVPIDATAASSQVARDQAIAAGEVRALRLLMERLAQRIDYPRLPKPDAGGLNNLIEGFSVSHERTSPVRYAADLTVIFRPDAVRQLMAQSGIPIADTPSRPVLVLPVWRDANGLKLFDETNPWRDAWIRIATGKGLVPLITPLGDVADLNAISADQAASGNAGALAAIAQRYNVAEVLVAMASGDAKSETIDQLVVTRYAIGGGRNIVNVTPRRPPEAFLATALAISQEIEEAWKAGIAGGPSPQAQNRPGLQDGGTPPPSGDGQMPVLAVRVPVTQLSEWLAIRKKLSDNPLVKKIDVNSLGVDGASVMLSYTGSEQQLQSSLAQSDLVLSNDGGLWILRARLGTSPGFAPPPGNAPPPNAPSGPTPPAANPPANMPLAGPPPGSPPSAVAPPPNPPAVYVGPAPGTGGTGGTGSGATSPAFTTPASPPSAGAPPATNSPGNILTR